MQVAGQNSRGLRIGAFVAHNSLIPRLLCLAIGIENRSPLGTTSSRVNPRVTLTIYSVNLGSGGLGLAPGCATTKNKTLEDAGESRGHVTMRDGSQSTCMRFHSRIDGWIPLDSAVESQQFRSHRRSTFCFEFRWIAFRPVMPIGTMAYHL